MGIQGPAWDLRSEYAGVEDSALIADLATLDQLLDDIAELNKGLDADDGVSAAQAIAKLIEQASTLLSNVRTFSSCLLSVDSQDDGAQKLKGRLQAYSKRCGELFEPLSEFVDSAPETVITRYLADPEVAPSTFLVQHGRKRRHERLSLSEETLVNGLSQDGIHAWGNLYDQLAGTLQCEVLVGNTAETMGIAQASGLLSSTDDQQRRSAWQAINKAWETHEESCAASLNAIAGWRLEMCQHRSRQQEVHFLDAPIHLNRISRRTLDTLIEVAETAKPLAQKAAKLQARAYGKAGFGPWDLRAPAPIVAEEIAAEIEFAEAIELIATSYGQIDPSMEAFVRMMLANRWIEGTVGPRKAPGAYCTGFAKSRTPRVYMTFTGGQSDVITLAHELGHALHSWIMRELPRSQKTYGMSLAESASTFGETLVRDALLARSESVQERLDMMWEEMSAFTSFLLNIPTRFEFEKRFYEARKERPLRPQEIGSLMSDAWSLWYGESLAEPDPMFWASKLHFYISGLSFYNFPYLFGYLFSLGIYAQRNAFGGDFYSRYAALLRDTGRMTAEELAERHLGAKLDRPEFWNTTIESLALRVHDFERILDEIER